MKLEKEISYLSLQNSQLKKENCVQAKIIQQFKLLYASTLKLNSQITCDAGHHRCKIIHRRYNYVNSSVKDQDHLCLPAKTVSKSEPAITDRSFYKKLSKNIDLLQYKYGSPTILNNKVLVASAETKYSPPGRLSKTVTRRFRNVPLVMYERRRMESIKSTNSSKNLVISNSAKLKCSQKEEVQDDTETKTDESGEVSSDASSHLNVSDTDNPVSSCYNPEENNSFASETDAGGSDIYIYDDFTDVKLYNEEEAYAREAHYYQLLQAGYYDDPINYADCENEQSAAANHDEENPVHASYDEEPVDAIYYEKNPVDSIYEDQTDAVYEDGTFLDEFYERGQCFNDIYEAENMVDNLCDDGHGIEGFYDANYCEDSWEDE